MDFVRVRNQCEHGVGQNRVEHSAQVVSAIGTAVLATGVGAYSSFYRGDAATPLVFAWALYAIYKDGGYRAPPPSDSDEFFFWRQKRQEEQRRGREKKRRSFSTKRRNAYRPRSKRSGLPTPRACAQSPIYFSPLKRCCRCSIYSRRER